MFKPKVLNFKTMRDTDTGISIMRPSRFSNPFRIGIDGTREEVIQKFKDYILSDSQRVEAVRKELKGKNLICCCKPLACHGDVLLEIANEVLEEDF